MYVRVQDHFRAVRASEKRGVHYPRELGDGVCLSEYGRLPCPVNRKEGCWRMCGKTGMTRVTAAAAVLSPTK